MNPTYPAALAAGLGAGNRAMRAAGRHQWNTGDREAACEAMRDVLTGIPVSEGGLLEIAAAVESHLSHDCHAQIALGTSHLSCDN